MKKEEKKKEKNSAKTYRTSDFHRCPNKITIQNHRIDLVTGGATLG